jgi:hypothetical protein
VKTLESAATALADVQPRVHPVHRKPTNGASEVTGNGHDYVAEAAGLITHTLGTFPKVTGVTSESSVGVAASVIGHKTKSQ